MIESETAPGDGLGSDWLPWLRKVYFSDLERGALTLQRAAAQLSISPRTLQRRLQNAGTSWSAELEAARRRRASELLADRRFTRESVARRVGYADSRSLRRAVRRWRHDQDVQVSSA